MPFTLIKLASGFAPSEPPANLYSTFSEPVVETLKTLPQPHRLKSTRTTAYSGDLRVQDDA